MPRDIQKMALAVLIFSEGFDYNKLMVYISYVRMCHIFKRPTTYPLSTQLGESLLMLNLKFRYSENGTKFEKENLP